MPVVAVSGYDLIALFQGHLHADDDGFLADIEMAEAADRAHAVELAGLFLEPPDQQHVAQRAQFLISGEFRRRSRFRCPALFLSLTLFFGAAMAIPDERVNSPLYPNSNRRERIA